MRSKLTNTKIQSDKQKNTLKFRQINSHTEKRTARKIMKDCIMKIFLILQRRYLMQELK